MSAWFKMRALSFFGKNSQNEKNIIFSRSEKSVFYIFSIFSVKDRKVVSQDPVGQIGLLDRQRRKKWFFHIFQLKYFKQPKHFSQKKGKICLKWQKRSPMGRCNVHCPQSNLF
jgi:hypothetical protein